MSGVWAQLRRVLLGGMLTGIVIALAGCGGNSVAQLPTVSAGVGTSAGVGSTGTDPTPSRPALHGSAAEISAYVSAQRQWVACVRQHGFDLPDPDAHGVVSLTAFPKSQPKARKAWLACQSHMVAMPESVQQFVNPKLTPAQKATKRKYADCMQTHGSPDFPDPGPDGNFTSQSWDQASAGAVRATKACASIVGDHPDTGIGVG